MFWGLIASFWIGNILLVLLNVPMIGIWVKLLRIPYGYLFPSALFFVCIGVYSANNNLFEVGETIVLGLFGYLLLRLEFHPAPIVLGFVLGSRFEATIRRALLVSHGDVLILIKHPISAFLLFLCVMLLGLQLFSHLRRRPSSLTKSIARLAEQTKA